MPSESPAALPDSIRACIERGGRHVTGVTRLSGGMISAAARIDTSDGPWFVKWSDDTSASAMFRAEADGLAAIRAVGGGRVPDTLFLSGQDETAPAFLAL